MAFARVGVHAVRRASLDKNALGASSDENAGAGGVRVGKPRFRCGLLRADGTAKAAIAADFVLIATDDVARHGGDVPAKRAQAALDDLLTRRNTVVLAIDLEAGADGMETARGFIAGEPRHAGGSPFGANVIGRAGRRRVIEDRAAAEAGASEQADAVIDSRSAAALPVEPSEASVL